MIQAVRANQWWLARRTFLLHSSNQVTQEVFRQTARSFYHLFHYLGDSKILNDFIAPCPVIDELIESSQKKERGVLSPECI